MFAESLIRNCAPTLAGLKTGSIFCCPYESRESLLEELRRMNKDFRKKGLRILPLRMNACRVLIYVYRPGKLQADLAEADAAEILRCNGYNPADCGGCVVHLARKLRQQEAFPHEIGLFLGYPPEDVRGFMENGACNCKCAGCWKVYGDEAAARKKFDQYKKCTRVYCDRWACGATMDRLTVAT